MNTLQETHTDDPTDRAEGNCPLTIERPLPSLLDSCCNDRVTFRVNKQYTQAIDELVEAGYFRNQSEAFRQGVKSVVEEAIAAYEDGGRDA